MDDAKTIWDYLMDNISNPYGVAGLMGNLYAESGLRPENLQNVYEKSLGMTDEQYTRAVDDGSYTGFDDDGAGYGLAQWTYSARKHNLLAYCRSRGESVGSLDAQLGFLWQELQGYSAVLAVLRGSKTVREASDAVLMKYERPADTSEAMREKRAEYGQRYFDEFEAGTARAEPVKRTGKEFMRAEELIKWLRYAATVKSIYMYAAYGFQVTDATIRKKAQQNLNGWYTPENIARLKKVANQQPPTWGFDCVNLLKGILWGWRGDEAKECGGAVYGSNGVPDTNANGMIKRCYDVTDDFTTILPGEGLWMEGHWGTYIGDGLAVECTSRWQDKAQITAVWNIGHVAGYNGRRWTKHGKLPWIYYDAETEKPIEPAEPSIPKAEKKTLLRGDTGLEVQKLQNDLIALGYDVGQDGADGEFGRNTEDAVRRFQMAVGLTADGIVGKKTWAAIDGMLAGTKTGTTITVAAGTWNVRSGPGTEYYRVGIANGGDVIRTTGEIDGNWVGVIWQGAAAWISQKAVKR